MSEDEVRVDISFYRDQDGTCASAAAWKDR